MSSMSKIKDILDNHPFISLISTAAISIAITWTVAEQVRVNPLQYEITKQEDEIKDYKEKTKNYKLQSEFERLVVYDENDYFKEGDVFDILGGQVSIEVSSLISADSVSFEIDALGESEQQHTDTYNGDRAVFKYQGNKYVINVKDFEEDESFDNENEAKFSISKIKN